LAGWFFGSVGERFLGLAALVGIGGLVYFTLAWLIGGIDRQAIRNLRRKKEPVA
jgi:putative peptidoglycan lipid II flippase